MTEKQKAYIAAVSNHNPYCDTYPLYVRMITPRWCAHEYQAFSNRLLSFLAKKGIPYLYAYPEHAWAQYKIAEARDAYGAAFRTKITREISPMIRCWNYPVIPLRVVD